MLHRTHRRCSSFPETQYNVYRNGRSRNSQLRLLKQCSEGSQQKADTNAHAKCLVSADNGSERVLEGENVVVVQNNDFVEDRTLSEDNSSLVKSPNVGVSKRKEIRTSQEGNVDVIIAKLPVTCDLRAWSSLPDLRDSSSASETRSRNVTTGVPRLHRTSSSVPERSSQLRQLRTGSLMLASSPSVFVLNSDQISHSKHCSPESLKGKDFGGLTTEQCSELSPSVLRVDYSLEVHSDTPTGMTEQRASVTQKFNKDWRHTPLRNLSKSAIKGSSKLKEDAGTKTNQKWCTSNFTSAETGSDSSDTLNLETNKSSDESQPSVMIAGPGLDRPCVRPSDLKLSVCSWDETDGCYTETQGLSSAVIGQKMQDEKPTKRKTIIIGSAPEHTGQWLSDDTVGLRSGHWKLQKKSFIESGGGSVLPMAIGFFPRPIEGQSLMSFLSSGQFSRPSAELDRENAHFSISEAMIAAIEQVGVNALYIWNLFLHFFNFHNSFCSSRILQPCFVSMSIVLGVCSCVVPVSPQPTLYLQFKWSLCY